MNLKSAVALAVCFAASVAAAGQQPMDNWVLMQAAVPAQCFDSAAPNFQIFLDGEAVVPTPGAYTYGGAIVTYAVNPDGSRSLESK